MAFPLRCPSAALLVALVAVAGCGSSSRATPQGRAAGESCASASECQSELVCLVGRCSVDAPAAAACRPPGAPRLVAGEPADPGREYAAAGAGCVRDVRAPVAPDDGVQDLGEHAVGEQLGFEVPAGTAALSIVSQEVPGTAVPTIEDHGATLPNSVVPTDVRLPGGSLLYDDLASPPVSNGYDDFTRVLAYYGAFTPGSGAFTVPNTSLLLDQVYTAGTLPSGTWRFTVNDFARECSTSPGCTGGSTSARYRIQVLARGGPLASTGTLDLEIYLVTRSALSAAEAPGDPHVRRWITSMATIFGRAGICLGQVTFHDVPEWARERWRVVDVDGTGPCDELSQLFTLAVPRNAVHLFLVDDLTSGAGGTGLSVLGVDGSIPGPSGVPGTVNSGAAMSASDLGFEVRSGACGDGAPFDVARCGSDRLAYVAAHETGHWLGLYHTTEMDGALFDPIADTPTCACASCAPKSKQPRCGIAATTASSAPTLMSASYCRADGNACGDGANLMFWVLDGSSSGTLTREQSQVMRLNPAVR